MSDYSKYLRTPEEVHSTLKSTKFKTSDLKQCTGILYSTIELDFDMKLIELDDHLLTALDENKCLCFKGDPQQFATLTSSNRTYELREVETSNTLLIFPTIALLQDVSANENNDTWKMNQITGGLISRSHFETLHCPPKLEKLLSILELSSFKDVQFEKQIDEKNLYDWERLRCHIQSSDSELEKAFNEYLIAIINGYYRLVSFEYTAQALTMMLDIMEEKGWEIDQVDKKETFNALTQSIPKSVFDIIFDNYAQPSNSCESLYTYNNEKVCRFLAEILLAASPINEYKQFMNAWRMGVPLKMLPKPEYLNGVAITRWNSQEARREIISFPVSNLSQDIHNRLDELFKAKDKWTVEEITPYILNFVESDVNFLLTKYARTSVVNGVRYYSSKYNK